MAETAKLGIADSLLANVQLAFAAADPTPPAITTQNGRLGGQLGDTILALAGVTGPLTYNLAASSVLALAQTADPAPTFVAHSTPHWVLGGQDSGLGGLVPAFDGAPATLPTPTTQSGLLGTPLGSVVFGLDGVAGPLVFNLAAQSALALAHTADPAPTFVAHESRRWVLGGQDSYLGGMELAYAGPPDPRPLTGNLTGKLGTVNSLLGGVRLALSLPEGESTGEILLADATSALSLSAEAGAAVVRSAAAESTISLTSVAGRNSLLVGAGESVLSLGAEAECASVRSFVAESTISVDVAAACAAARLLAAESVLELTDEAKGVRVRSAAAESTLNLETTGDAAAVRSLSAESTLALATEAARNNLPNLSAESTLSLDTTAGLVASRALSAESVINAAATAGFTAVRVLAAESILELTDESKVAAQARLAQSVLTLDGTADCAVVRQLAAESALDLATDASRNNLLAATAESTLDLTSAAGRNNLLAGVGESILAVAGSADSVAVRALTAESTISADVTAGSMVVRPVAAESTLELTGEAEGNVARSASADSTLSLGSAASVKAVRQVTAASSISLASAAWHSQILLVSAESVLTLESTAHPRGIFLEADASSELALTDEALCTHVVGHCGEVWDWIELWDWATVTVVRGLKAENTIELVQTEHIARPWYVSAETPVQTVELVYDAEKDDLVEQISGLQDTASAARPLTAVAHSPIPLHQTASAVRVKPTAIAVSAESVLELLGEVRLTPNPSAGDWLSLRHEAHVEKCKLVRSRLDLSQEAAVIVSVPRGAASALTMKQAATFYKVFPGVLQQYHPFIGEGAPGSPAPPPVMIGGI